MFEITIISGNEWEVPLPCRRRYPSVGRGYRSSGTAAFGRDFSPFRTGSFIREQCGEKVYVKQELGSPFRTPSVHSGPKKKLGSGHKGNEALMFIDNLETLGVERMIRLEENRHDVGVESQDLHFWRRSSRIRL
jgi:hypothetical protein